MLLLQILDFKSSNKFQSNLWQTSKMRVTSLYLKSLALQERELFQHSIPLCSQSTYYLYQKLQTNWSKWIKWLGWFEERLFNLQWVILSEHFDLQLLIALPYLNLLSVFMFSLANNQVSKLYNFWTNQIHSASLSWILFIISFKINRYHTFLAFNASILFWRDFGLVILGSLLTALLLFLKNFWFTPWREAYFCVVGLLIPFWWLLWFWFLEEWLLCLAIVV